MPAGLRRWRSGPRARQLSGDDSLLDLGGAIRDQVGHDVAKALLQRQLGRVAKMAVDLHRGLDGVFGDNRRPPLAHRRDRGVRLASGSQPQYPVTKPSSSLEVRRMLVDRKRHPLELDNRLPESFTVVRERNRFIETGP